MKNLFFLLVSIGLILSACRPKCSISNEFEVDGIKYFLDTVAVSSTIDSVQNYEAAKITLSPEIVKLFDFYEKNQENIIKILKSKDNKSKGQDIVKLTEYPQEFKICDKPAPAGIRDLKDGVVIEAMDFKKGDEAKLGFLGFANVEINTNETVTVVEFAQHGSQVCNGKKTIYGIGCRLMMHVTSRKRSAKLNSPQQITASVIFDKADVKFNMKTFGITGPGVARLNDAGGLGEDTYKRFMQEVSNLIVDAYSNESDFIIHPQPLVLTSSK